MVVGPVVSEDCPFSLLILVEPSDSVLACLVCHFSRAFRSCTGALGITEWVGGWSGVCYQKEREGEKQMKKATKLMNLAK
jgi:hypothetical protein